MNYANMYLFPGSVYGGGGFTPGSLPVDEGHGNDSVGDSHYQNGYDVHDD